MTSLCVCLNWFQTEHFFDAEILKGKGKEGVMNINQKAKYILANSTTRHNIWKAEEQEKGELHGNCC